MSSKYNEFKGYYRGKEMRNSKILKKVPFLEPKDYLKEGEYNLDDLLCEVQDRVIKKYIEHNPVIWRYAVSVLRHFTFDKTGKIIRGFDE